MSRKAVTLTRKSNTFAQGEFVTDSAFPYRTSKLGWNPWLYWHNRHRHNEYRDEKHEIDIPSHHSLRKLGSFITFFQSGIIKRSQREVFASTAHSRARRRSSSSSRRCCSKAQKNLLSGSRESTDSLTK